MAQSALTVTPPSPTPPTNMSFTGATGPNPPNYTKNTYNDPKNWDWRNPKDFPPPYFDDGTAGALHTFAANTAALASGSGATAGGTEGTYPGASAGAVPASTSVAHEAAGSEVTVLAAGNIQHTYPGAVTLDMSRSASVGPAATQATRDAGPNASHASSLSPATNPTLTSVANAVSGAGTTPCVATGTNFTRQSVIYVNGVAQTTTFTSSTSITAPTAPKRATAGTVPVYVVTGGVVQTAPVNWTFT